MRRSGCDGDGSAGNIQSCKVARWSLAECDGAVDVTVGRGCRSWLTAGKEPLTLKRPLAWTFAAPLTIEAPGERVSTPVSTLVCRIGFGIGKDDDAGTVWRLDRA